MMARTAAKTSRGLPIKRVSELVDAFLAAYNGNIPLDILIAEQQEHLYGVEQSRENLGEALAGSYHGQSAVVTLVAANLADDDAVTRTLRHEILGHYGLNTFRPADKRALLEAVLQTQGERSLAPIWGWVERNYGDQPALIQAEEAFARVAEDEPAFTSRAWNHVRAVLTKGLRAIGLVRKPMTPAELRDTARQVADGIRRGRRRQQTFPESDAAQFRKEDLMPAAERAPWGNFPAVIRNGDLGELKEQPEYVAAKRGDPQAALKLVQRLLTDETVAHVKTLLGERRPRILPVLATEAAGNNMLPLAMAQVLAHRLGLEVELGIVQREKVARTDTGADHRLVFNPTFTGPVEAHTDFFIVDDTLTMGGTVASLRGYVENRCGHVLGASVMVAHPGAVDLAVKPGMIAAIEQKHGPEMNAYWKETFGYGIEQLTQGEAGHLKAAASVDALRDRLAAARDAVGIRMDASGTRAPEPGETASGVNSPAASPSQVAGFFERALRRRQGAAARVSEDVTSTVTPTTGRKPR